MRRAPEFTNFLPCNLKAALTYWLRSFVCVTLNGINGLEGIMQQECAVSCSALYSPHILSENSRLWKVVGITNGINGLEG